jgi:glycosyltransferase involved in cell wall biosynthesis
MTGCTFIKILQLTQYFRKNDAASIIVETLTEELERLGNSVVIASPDQFCMTNRAVCLSYGSFSNKVLSETLFGRFFACSFSYGLLMPKMFVGSKNVDVILAHHHNHHLAALSCYFLSKIRKVPYCIFVHDLLTYGETSSLPTRVYDKLFFVLNSAILKKADVVFVQSTGIKKCIDHKNVVVLPNCTPIRDMSKQNEGATLALRKRLGIEDNPVLLFLGTATEDRGLVLLVRSIADLVSMGYTKVVAVFVGRAPDMPRLINLASELKVENHLIFTGEVPHEEVPVYLQMADIAVGPLALPPTLYTLPVKILEYMAAEKPTIALKGSIPDGLFIHKQNGLLLNQINERELTQLLVYLLENPEDSKSIGARARQSLISTFDSKRVVQQLYDKLTSIITLKNSSAD